MFMRLFYMQLNGEGGSKSWQIKIEADKIVRLRRRYRQRHSLFHQFDQLHRNRDVRYL